MGDKVPEIVWSGEVFYDGQKRAGRVVRCEEGVLVCEVENGHDAMMQRTWKRSEDGAFHEFLIHCGNILVAGQKSNTEDCKSEYLEPRPRLFCLTHQRDQDTCLRAENAKLRAERESLIKRLDAALFEAGRMKGVMDAAIKLDLNYTNWSRLGLAGGEMLEALMTYHRQAIPKVVPQPARMVMCHRCGTGHLNILRCACGGY